MNNMRYFDTIIIHCTATMAGVDFSVRDVTEWHKAQGWRDCGYHYIIRIDGTIQKGRPLDEEGAHCRGHNKDSVGVCYVGGLDKNGRPADTRTPAQKRALARLIWKLTVQAMNAGFGIPQVFGHRDFNKFKDCPCFDARREYN